MKLVFMFCRIGYIHNNTAISGNESGKTEGNHFARKEMKMKIREKKK